MTGARNDGNPVKEIHALAGELHRISTVLGASASSADSDRNLTRALLVAETLLDIDDTDLRLAGRTASSTLSNDITLLLRTFPQFSATPDGESQIERLLDILCRDIARVSVRRPERLRAERGGRVNQADVRAASRYGDGSARLRRGARTFAGLGAFGVIAAVAMSLWATSYISANGGLTEFWARIGIGCTVLLLSLAVLIQAERYRRASAESDRLEVLSLGLAAYLEPLPPSQQALLRGILTPRMFPRLLDDNDPLREPIWPTAEQIIRAIELDVRRQDQVAGGGSG